MSINYLKTKQYVIVVKDGMKPVNFKSGSKQALKIVDLINKGKFDEVEQIIDPTKHIEKYTKGDFTVNMEEETIIDKKTGIKMPTVLRDIFIKFSQNSYPYIAIKNFWKNILKNPNKESIIDLYNFLETGKYPLTKDGCFLAYKYVTKLQDGNLVDSHSQTFINNPGCIVSMDRKSVDSNRNVTCSTGLHVASYKYASDCGCGQVLIEVKVNPKDVVSVPTDYNNQKMRCCRYEVIKICSGIVDKDYLNNEYILGLKNVIKEKVKSNINEMTAQEIINHVQKETGELITIRLKNKKAILKKATELLANKTQKVCQDTIDLTDKTASEIINIIKEQTGESITIGLKNKKSIVKKAISILNKNSLNFKI